MTALQAHNAYLNNAEDYKKSSLKSRKPEDVDDDELLSIETGGIL